MKKIRFEPHKYEKEELAIRELSQKAQEGYAAGELEVYRKRGTSDFYVSLHRESLTESPLTLKEVEAILEEEYAIAYEEEE